MLSRRTFLGTAAAGTGGLLAAACGGAAAPQQGAGQGQPASGPKRGQLTYQSWADLSRPDTQAYWGWVEKEYAARFPGASFKHEIVDFDSYPQKFTIMAAAGTVPDVMSTSNAWMRDFWALGGLTALDDLVKKAPDVAYNKFVPAAAFYGIRQGKIAGVPTGGPDSEVTLVNTRHFKEAGLDPSYDKLKSWTWEDFDTAADKLTVRSGTDVQRAGYQVKVPDGRHLAVWMYSQGGALYNKDYTGLAVDNEQGVRALDHLLLLLNGKRVSNGLGGNLLDLFYQGRAAMVQVNASDMQPTRLRAPQIQFDIFAYPRHPQGGKYATATWINMHTIPKGTKILDQAWEFLVWYASLDGVLKRLEMLNSYSPRLDLVETPLWKAVLKDFPQLQRAFDVATVGGERPGLRFDQMEAAMKPIFTAVMNGQTSPKTAVADLEQAAKPLLAELPAAAR
jgi:ABC-type glycerol-3-phosphate transport system substrate-binding protein